MIKFLEFLYDLVSIGRSAAGDIKKSSDIRMAKRMREAIEEGDEEKFRKIMAKNFTILNKADIIGLATTPSGKGVLFSVDAAVKFVQLFRDLRRCERSKK